MNSNNKIKQLKFALGLALVLSVASCFSSNQNNQNEIAAVAPLDEASFPAPKSSVNLAQPLRVSEEPGDVELCRKINRTIEESEFSNARWGIAAISLKDGRLVCEREGGKLFNPASVQKILTSVVALEMLGADFRWQTKILAAEEIENGEFKGDLIIYGTGAPDFNDASLGNLVNQLQAKNLKRIKGNIVGDESFFRGENFGDGWAWNEIQWYYGAEASAMSINHNQTTVSLRDGKFVAATDYVKVSSAVEPVTDIEAVGLQRGLGDNSIHVWGNGKNLDARVAVQNPALWSAQILKEALERKGIVVEGAAASANWKDERRPKQIEIAAVESQTLGEIVRRMNKDSINLYAELLLRTLGKRFGETAPDENPKTQKLRGTGAAGASVIKKWLTENNVATGEIKIHDGSGLSRLDFVTPEAVGRALVFAAQSKYADAFIKSLPVAGTDGTLRGRLGNVRGQITGKTGSITYVNSLAGYAKNSGGDTLAFVILCNNQTRRADSSVLIDSMATILTE